MEPDARKDFAGRTASQKRRTRSRKCNGLLLSQIRKNLGWTQADLAMRSGYTARLISKAESGRPIALNTLKHLATALSTDDATVSPEDLATNPVAYAEEFIREMYLRRASVLDRVQHLLHDDIVFHFGGDPITFPSAGEHAGIEAGRRAFEAFFQVFEPPQDLSELEQVQFLTTCHGALAWGDTWIHPSGRPISTAIQFALRMDFRAGKLVLFDYRFDTQAAAKQLDIQS